MKKSVGMGKTAADRLLALNATVLLETTGETSTTLPFGNYALVEGTLRYNGMNVPKLRAPIDQLATMRILENQ